MAQISRIFPRQDGLNTRRIVTVELPEFVIRALQYRAEVANIDSTTDEETVSFNDVIEWYVLSPLSVKEMPHWKKPFPGLRLPSHGGCSNRHINHQNEACVATCPASRRLHIAPANKRC